MANLVDPWRNPESPYSIQLDEFVPYEGKVNKANVFDVAPNFIQEAKNRSYYLYPWKITTLEALIQRGKARLEKAYSIGVDKGKFIFGYVLKFNGNEPFLPIGDVGIVVPEDKNDTISSPKITSTILVPLIANNEKYAIKLELKRNGGNFRQITTSFSCPGEPFQSILSPDLGSNQTATGIGSVILAPETNQNRNEVRYYAAVKTEWLNTLQDNAQNNDTWKIGRFKCPQQNTHVWYNTPFNTFRVISDTTSFNYNMQRAYGLKIDYSEKVPMDAPPVKKKDKPLPPLEKDYTWVWIIVGIIVVISLFIFLYFVLK